MWSYTSPPPRASIGVLWDCFTFYFTEQQYTSSFFNCNHCSDETGCQATGSVRALFPQTSMNDADRQGQTWIHVYNTVTTYCLEVEIRQLPKKFCNTFYTSVKINSKCLQLILWSIRNVPFATAAPRNNPFSSACAGGHQK
jgi:hypothetical protein